MCQLSIVVPTRDRPEQLKMLLYSLAVQDTDNFEVIISDNSSDCAQEEMVRSFKKQNYRYYRPQTSLGMCDHWDFAISHAKGDYVSILIDKYMMFPYAVTEILKTINENQGVDIISWLYEGVYPEDASDFKNMEAHIVKYRPEYVSATQLTFNPREELLRRRANSSYHRSTHGSLYFRGKIPSGVYSKSLLNKIVLNYGRVFPPYAPDFTSCTLALSLATKCLDMNRVLGQFGGYNGNGASVTSEFRSLARFLEENHCLSKADLLPVPGLIASVDNWVGYDLYVDEAVHGRASFEGFGWVHFFKNARTWVELLQFDDTKMRAEQFRLLLEAEKQYTEGGHAAASKFEASNLLGLGFHLFKKYIKKIPYAIFVYRYCRDVLSSQYVKTNRMRAFEIGASFHKSGEDWEKFKLKYREVV